MSAAVSVAFNLLLNGVGSFAIGYALARAAEVTFRVQPGRAHVALSSLPFVKVALDLVRGVPAGSFLWLRARGVPQDIGSFRIGLGFKWCFPIVDIVLGAVSNGRTYAQSYADLLHAALSKKVGPFAPAVLVAGLGAVSAWRLGARIVGWASGSSRALPHGESSELSIGWRRVKLCLSESDTEAPHVTGVLRPRVVMPRRLFEAMPDEERRAAILHELGHVAHHHLLVVTLVGLVVDLFWFVPGIGRASRRLRRACELAADEHAASHGASRVALASAIVRSGEALLTCRRRTSVGLGLDGSLVSERVERLLREPSVRARFGFQHPVLSAAIVVWLSVVVTWAVLLGNH